MYGFEKINQQESNEQPTKIETKNSDLISYLNEGKTLTLKTFRNIKSTINNLLGEKD
jgi:hypothetical protein